MLSIPWGAHIFYCCEMRVILCVLFVSVGWILVVVDLVSIAFGVSQSLFSLSGLCLGLFLHVEAQTM